MDGTFWQLSRNHTQDLFPVCECVSTVYLQFLLVVNIMECLQALEKM